MIKKQLTGHRLYIHKSNKHIYAQIIDNQNNKVIISSSTLSKAIKEHSGSLKNCKTAKAVGENIAMKLKQLGIEKVVFDRGKNIYHGQVKALANATRENGIIF
uniref:Large ribosomal subunit protein uL18c n=1 Tax=Chondria sp. (in: red algae) TaxID=1982705 RepID=A0A1Z1MED4_9FLOR|nr:ribosomal protein L18 [Chondria sp. (in: red algae)]